jgi:hypothetical protein
MARSDERYTSELEREFELETDAGDEQGETEDGDDAGAAEWELEADDDAAEASADDGEWEAGEGASYADRLRELSHTEFESEAQLDQEVRDIVDEMEREYFFGKWGSRLRKIGGGLVRQGLGKLAGRFPALKGLQAVTQLARGNLKGALGSLAKTGLTAALGAHPLGAAALPVLKGLGFEAAEEPDGEREAWENYVTVAREAFDHLGRHLDEAALDPAGASKLAAAAFQAGLGKVQAQGGRTGGGRRRRRRVIRLRRGDKLIVVVE